jgi:biotin transport system ATP-binding protein
MSCIEIRGLSHTFYNGFPGLNQIDLTVERGEFVVIAGRNGSGKTTFCRHLNGLLQPTSGTIRINGLQVEKHPAVARRKVGMVFQNADAQIVGETVYSDVAFGPENLKLPRSEIKHRVQQALEITGLTGKEERSPYSLSGGEKRKLAIAGILAMNPEILVFDEPFTNLDYPGSVQILRQIIALHQKQHTILLVTHELEKVVAHASRLVIFEKGRIAKEGDPAAVIKTVETFGIREPCSSKLGHGIVSWLN